MRVANYFCKSHMARSGVCLAAIVALSGCAAKTYSPLAPPTSATDIPLTPQGTPEVVVLAHEPAAVIGLDNVDVELPPTIATNSRPTATPTLTFGRGWIPLRIWSERCALGTPERITSSGATSYRI